MDKTRTTTNAVQEIYEVLGSRRRGTPSWKRRSRTLEEQGLNVDIRHIMLVADLMTNDGDVKAIGRHGISGRKSSVLARAAFEITAVHLLHAALALLIWLIFFRPKRRTPAASPRLAASSAGEAIPIDTWLEQRNFGGDDEEDRSET